jgi:succinoglycan biosynthesis protein ExoA
MPRGPLDVSVLVPVLNEEGHLRDAAAAMLAQEFDGAIEYLFIDGGSSDASLEILAELAAADRRVRVLQNPARRTPHALNLGLRAAGGEFIVRMDAHTIYPARYIAAGVTRLKQGGAEWVSGPQLAVGTNPGSRLVARALTTSLGPGGAGFRRDLHEEIEVDTGFTGIWQRSTLLTQGGWDEDWVNDQDVELAARIRKAGGRIICIPAMAAEYVPRATLAALSRQYLTYGTYRAKTAGRHPESMRPSQLLPAALTLATLAVAAPGARNVRRLARAGIGAYVAALASAAVRAGRDEAPAQAARLPLVWITMHLSYGAGFWRGCLRYGAPLPAILQASGLRRASSRGR